MRIRSIAATAIVAIVLGGTAAVADPGAVAAREVACPDQPLTVGDLVRLWSDGGGYAGLGGATNPRGRACYSRSAIRIRAYVNRPEGLGGANTYVIHPRWLAEDGALVLFGSSREVAPGYGAGRFYPIAVPPSLGRVERQYRRNWVDVTAHFDDPAARRCHATGLGGPTRREAVALCRDILVLSSISRAAGPLPDSATARAPADPAPGPASPLWPMLVAAGALGTWLWRRRTSRSARRRG